MQLSFSYSILVSSSLTKRENNYYGYKKVRNLCSIEDIDLLFTF
jgi:hypothetical protein